MNGKLIYLIVHEAEKDKFDFALSDVLCWLNGFVQGGGNYSPESQYTLRDLRDLIRRPGLACPPLNGDLATEIQCLKHRILAVANECNCRADHGADGDEHLLAIEQMLREILK